MIKKLMSIYTMIRFNEGMIMENKKIRIELTSTKSNN